MSLPSVRSRPDVSVVLATHNRPQFISSAIDSVLGQTLPQWELIVVDDGSTPETQAALRPYKGRVHYVYQRTRGRSGARNTGIRAARGEYVAFLDDDDIWLPPKLERQMALLSDPEVGLVHTYTEIINGSGRIDAAATAQRLRLHNAATRNGSTYERLSGTCVMFLSSVVVRRECFGRVGLFDMALEAFEDWDLYLRVARAYRIATCVEPLVHYRVHGSQTSNDEFTRGRIRAAHKHLALLQHDPPTARRAEASYQFCVHLAIAYHMAGQPVLSRAYALRALRFRPGGILSTRLLRPLLQSLHGPLLPPGR
jgi:glycosyltransferase involved in cell wall biosynthesis